MAKSSIYVMSDEEFENMKKEEEKESLISSLLDASKNDKKFTTKNVKKREKTPDISDDSGNRFILSSLEIPDKVGDDFNLSDEHWDGLMNYFDEISPIDDITEEERYRYRRNTNDDEYTEMFKKERSMLNDVLSELQQRSKLVNKKISSMTTKSAYGVSKNYTDLITASVNLDNTKLSTIKELVNIKKTIADLKLKDKRLNPDDGTDDRDSIADAFYKQIMGGGNKQFLQNTLSPYSSMQGGIIGRGSNNSSDEDDEDDEYIDDIGFNLSQPIPQEYNYNDESLNADPYGYIANENKKIQIVLHRYDDGSIRFAAIDENGEVVDDYELPDSVLLEDIKIKPMAKYAYDRYERKYKIIDIQTSNLELDDLDDDYYDNLNNDDKYDLG